MLAGSNSAFLERYRQWRAGMLSTRELYDETAEARRRVNAAQAAGFTGRELVRLEIYRRAVLAGFYNDGGTVTNFAFNTRYLATGVSQ